MTSFPVKRVIKDVRIAPKDNPVFQIPVIKTHTNMQFQTWQPTFSETSDCV